MQSYDGVTGDYPDTRLFTVVPYLNPDVFEIYISGPPNHWSIAMHPPVLYGILLFWENAAEDVLAVFF